MKIREIYNSINYIERKLKEELFELKQEIEEHYKTLGRYKSACLADAHNDYELKEIWQDELLGQEEEKSIDQMKEWYEKVTDQYCGELWNTLLKVETFKDADLCVYLMDEYRGYANLIKAGRDLEILIEKLEEFLKTI